MFHMSAAAILIGLKIVSVNTSEDKLVTDLLKNYNKEARPRPDGPSKPVEINIKFSLKAIEDLDAKKQQFKVRGFISFQWIDPRFKWDPLEYGGIERLVFHPSKIWVPEIGLWNTVSDIFDDSHYDRIFVRVSNDSSIGWEPGCNFVSTCDIDIRYFPFDEQVCILEFGNWANIGNDVNITISTTKPDTSKYTRNVEWELIETKSVRHEDTFPCCPGVYPYVHFKFHVKRKPLYFIINIIIPSVLLSMLVLLVFVLPAESGEKISLGVTILVAYALFILMISESVPRTSDAVPIIVIYLMFFMGCSTIALLLSVLVLYLHHKKGNTAPPSWLQKLAYCLSVIIKADKPQISKEGKMKKDKNKNVENDVQQVLDKDSMTKMVNDWKKIAELLDRFFFLFFGSFILFLSCIILGVVPLLKPEIDIEN